MLQETIEKYPNLIVGKKGCCFCEEAIKVLRKEHVDFLYLCYEKNPDIVKYVNDEKKHFTFPMIFLDRKFIGGCDDMKKHLKSDDF